MLIINYSPQEFEAELNEAANEADPWIDPRALSGDDRRNLKARIEDGSIQSIRAWVTMLGDEPNTNRIRPTPGTLGELMGGRAAIAFVKNHSRDVDDIIGRVEQTRVRARASDGVEQLQGLHRFNDKGAMSAFVNGNMTDFSVGLRGGKAPLVCSGCEKEARRGLFGAMQFSCNCEDAELFIADATLLHNAWVTEGAYRDTGYAQNNSTKHNPILHLVASEGPTETLDQDTPMEPTIEQLSADLASANATILARDERIDALEDIVFEEVFRAAIKAHRVTPAQRPQYDGLRSKAGLDFALDFLAGQTPREDMPTTPQGRPPVEAEATPDQTAGDKTYGYKVALAAGTITKAQYERFTA